MAMKQPPPLLPLLGARKSEPSVVGSRAALTKSGMPPPREMMLAYSVALSAPSASGSPCPEKGSPTARMCGAKTENS